MIYKKTKNIFYEGVYVDCTVTFRLDDECKNGVQDFSITAKGICSKGKLHGPRKGRFMFGGCCHDIVAKHFRELRPFISLHLCNEFGQPMHSVANFTYHILQHEPDEKLKKLYRVTDEQLAELKKAAHHKEYFQYLLYKLGVIDRWKREADEAIEWMEKHTNHKYTATPDPKHTLIYTDEWLADMEKRNADGEFADEVLLAKQAEAHRKWQEESRAELEIERAFDNRKYEIAMWLIENCPTANYRFFAHNGFGHRKTPQYEVTLNAYSWKPILSLEEINQFMKRNDLPEGMTIKIEEKK